MAWTADRPPGRRRAMSAFFVGRGGGLLERSLVLAHELRPRAVPWLRGCARTPPAASCRPACVNMPSSKSLRGTCARSAVTEAQSRRQATAGSSGLSPMGPLS
jgi:hypothetical protein